MKKIILFYRENAQWLTCYLQHLTRVFVNWCLTSYSKEGELNKETRFNKNWFNRFAFLFLVLSQISFYGQSNTNNSQWGKNGPASAPTSPVSWANGNAQGTNSHFTEGESIPTRIELAGLTPNVPASVTFDINIIQGSDGQHAFDFFTGPNRIEEVVSPLDGLTGYNLTKSTYLFPIPNASNTGGVPSGYYNETALKMACQQNADAAFPDKNSIWIYNGTVSNISYIWGNEDDSSTQKTYCTVTFTPTSTKALLVLGCHIGAELTVSCEGWGVGNGASTISGSPYHFHIQNICSPLNNCVTLGSQDQQMASSSVIVPPTCSISPSSAEICAGATATFTASGNGGSGGAPYTFAWSGPNGYTATTASITVGVAGTYSVVVSDKNGVPTEAPCSVNLIVNNNPTPSVDDEVACVGSTATFSTVSSPGFSYQWYLNNILIPDATSNSYTTPALTIADNGGIYKVIVIDGNHNTNCDGEDSGILTVNALPVVVANDAPVCTGFTVQLTASPSGGTWSGAHISATGLFDAAGLSSGSYNVTYTYTDGNQCTNSDGAVVTVNALPVVVANDAPVCTGFTVQLTASPSGGTWSGAHISATGLFDAAGLASGSYNVTYTYTDGNQCTNSDGAVVTVNALPVVVANDAPVCTGFTVQLTASPSGGTWSGAHISATGLFDAAGLASGSYNVTYTYTDGNQCTNSDGAVVTVNALPVVVANDAPVCTGFTVQLTASPSGGTWSGAHISATGLFDAAGLASGLYNVTYTYTDGNQCTNSDGAVVTVNALPVVVANDAPVCTGFTVQLTASPSGGTWSGDHISATGLFDAAGLASGSYNVTYTYTDGNQCTNSDGAVVTVNALPVVIANDAPVCTGFTVQLTASPSGGTWSGAHISATGLFDAAGLASGLYNVTYTYTDGNQCTNSDGAVVTVNALPVVIANDAPVCTGFTVQLTASPSGGTWSGAHISATGLFDAAGLSSGLYNVTYTYTDGNQCTNSDGAVVTVNALPVVIANDAPVCTGFTVQLTASPSGGTWSGAHISATGLFDAAGLSSGSYNVTYTYTDGNQCTNSDGAVVTVNALPVVIANDAPVCTGFTVQLTASPSGGTWSGAHISATGLFDAAGLASGLYNVTYTYTDGNQCTNSDGAVVTVNALPVVDCPDDSIDNLVQCGVSASSAQVTTNSNFNTWFGSFAILNPSLEVINITYDYEPNSAQPLAGNAPLNPTLGVPGVVETSVLVTWTVQNANGCVSSCSATFALSYNCTIGCENTMTPVLCYGASTGSITVVAQGGTPPYTVNLYRAPDVTPYRTEGPLNTGAINVVFDNLPAGTYSYSVTDSSNGDSCNNNEPIVITQPEVALTSIINDIDVLCNGNSTGSIDLTPSGGTPPYTYVWTATNGGEVPVGQEGNQDLTDLIAGTYSVVITDFNGNAGGCRNENSAIISQPDKLNCSIEKNNDEQCAGGLNGSATVNVTGGNGEYTYLWDNNETTATALGLSGGLHSVTVTDANGCSTSCEITIETIPCDDGHCTYTQGFYGNYGGLGCTPDLGVVNSQVMMARALIHVGGSFSFGSVDTGNYFLLKLTDVNGAANPRDNKIYKMLPGGGTPRKLIGFATYDDYSTWQDNDPLNKAGSRKGAINNNLLSQTMTLFFNIQIDGSLASFELESSFATAKAVTCGSNVPDMETIQVFNIPQSVINYLNSNGGATVGNLFILANKALGGENIGALSHSNINAAVDAINRGFDECRVQVGMPEDIKVETVAFYDLGDNELKVNAYPNPFKDYIGLSYMFDYDSNVDIQIFDVKGVLLYEFKDKDAYYGKEMRIDIAFNHGKGELFILKLITNKETIIKKVISSNY